MKNKLYFGYILAIISCTLISCHSDDPIPTSNDGDSYIECKLNGFFWKATYDEIQYTMLGGIAKINMDTLAISGAGLKSDGINYINAIQIGGKNISGIGTYDLNDPNIEFGGATLLLSLGTGTNPVYAIGASTVGSSGTLTIEQVKDVVLFGFPIKAVKGTFSGVAINNIGETITITDGKFFDYKSN
ncbi:MAG: hypothetical protein R2777_01585 [Chitinophagales bacterium]